MLRPHEPLDSLAAHEAPDAFAVGAFDGERLVAVGFVAPDGERWRVRGMAAEPEARGRGAGSAVLAALIEHAAGHGATSVWAHVRVPARTLYERAGFVATSGVEEVAGIGPHLAMELALAPAPNEPDGGRRLAATVALAVAGVFVAYAPITLVGVSLTAIGRATGAATSDLQWVSDAYIIAMATAILSAGVFGDLHGRRRVYLVGLALTTAGAGLAALAGTLDGDAALHLLWVGQAVGGLGAGVLLPTTLALVAHAVPDLRDRARYVSMWATGLVLGLAVGPLISGSILEFAGWGWIFVPVVALAAAVGAIAWRHLPDSSAPDGRRLDWPGQGLGALAMAASIFGVIEGGRQGWGSAPAVAGLAAGAAALGAFVAVELRSASPLLELRLFRSPAFTAAGLGALVGLFAVVGSFFVLSLFFGSVQHRTPLEMGVRFLFINLVTAVASPVFGRLMRRLAPIAVLAAGLVVGAVAMLSLRSLGEHAGFGAAAWRLATFGLAQALMFASTSVAAIHAAPHRLAGMASATNTALRQYGGALGPAVLGVVLTSRMAAGDSMTTAMGVALAVAAVALAATAVACVVALALGAGSAKKL